MSDDRKKLIRRHFEMMRELTWKEDLEPKCRAEGMDAKEISGLRKAWNVFSEARDWEWWQEHAAKESNEQLRADIKEAQDRMEAITQYRQALSQSSGRRGNGKDKGIDR